VEKREQVLLDGVRPDATLYRAGERWWMFAAARGILGLRSMNRAGHLMMVDGFVRRRRI
jgi:hypothetical protein